MNDHAIFVVDDDSRMREALAELLSAMQFHVVVCASASEYLRLPKPDVPTCLILDVKLPGISGLELQARFQQEERPAIIFISAHGDIPSSVKAIKAGAIDFLPKPFDRVRLVAAVREALALDQAARTERAERMKLQGRLASLTRREADVLPWVVAGYLNKQIAAELGISDVTLQIHRGQVMRKMKAESFAELVRMATKLHIPLPEKSLSPHRNPL